MKALLLATALAAAAPSDADRVYYNARMALREGAPAEVVRLWLLRNALEDATLRVSAHDADHRSTTWAALGQLGLCADGLGPDSDGAGLWPLALHNWTLRNRVGRRPPLRQPTFEALEVDRQQRHVSTLDVLDARELAALDLSRGRCLGPQVERLRAGLWPWQPLSDRAVTARLLQHLLERAGETLDPETVRGRSVLAARIFDLDLLLAGLARQEARQKARQRTGLARSLGLGGRSVAALEEEAAPSTLDPRSRAADILRQSAAWPAEEWMALTPDRRRYLFDEAAAFGVDPEALGATALALVDAHIARGDGREVEEWIARVPPAERAAVWSGPRGASLLALGPEAGFRERAPVALHRGIAALQTGRLDDALRAFALAREAAPDSRQADALAALSRRWLAHVAGQFEITEPLLVTFRSLLPRSEYHALLEDLLWRAAWRADAASFAVGLAALPERSAARRRVALLAPLADGRPAALARRVASGLRVDPGETLRALDDLLERLEREDAATRARHRGTLAALEAALAQARARGGWPERFVRRADALSARAQSIAEGVGALPDDPAAAARALAPDHAVHAGVVRLAPSDPVPWPFSATVTPPPSALTPIDLTPVEWRDADGALVFGWALGQ